MGRASTWEPGMNARTPTSTERPPFTRPITRPEIVSCSWSAFSRLSQILRRAAFSWERTHVAFRRMAALDHHLDQIAGMHRDGAAGIGELRERSDAVRLVADIDEDVAAGNLQDPAFQNLVPGGRRKMAVIFEEMLIFFRIHRRDRRLRLFQCSGRIVLCHWSSSPGSLKSALWRRESREIQDSINYREAVGVVKRRALSQ